jgi:hypothetical protein
VQAVLLLLVLLLIVIAATIVPAYAILYYLDHRKAIGRPVTLRKRVRQ